LEGNGYRIPPSLRLLLLRLLRLRLLLLLSSLLNPSPRPLLLLLPLLRLLLLLSQGQCYVECILIDQDTGAGPTWWLVPVHYSYEQTVRNHQHVQVPILGCDEQWRLAWRHHLSRPC
jgi:hypothetical protein